VTATVTRGVQLLLLTNGRGGGGLIEKGVPNGERGREHSSQPPKGRITRKAKREVGVQRWRFQKRGGKATRSAASSALHTY